MCPWPTTDGGRIRIRQHAVGATRLGPVTVLALERDEIDIAAAVEEARAEGVELRVVPRRGSTTRDAFAALRRGTSYYLARYADSEFVGQLRELGDRPWRMIQAEFSFMAPYRRVAAQTPGLRGVPWVLDEHNVEWIISDRLGQRGTLTGADLIYCVYSARERPLRKREEIAACEEADSVLCVTSVDADALKAAVPRQRFAVVPTGLQPDDRLFSEPPAEPPTAVFIAKMDYRPNVDAVLWFYESILPLVRQRHPDFQFRVIGSNPPKAVTAIKPEGVEVTGWVEDPREHLRAATMAAVPLRAGSGARLKILEAMALGRPVVSTTIGAEGIEITPGVEFECADDPPAFAEAMCRLIEDERRRVSIGLASRAIFQQNYSTDGAIAALLDFYDQVGIADKPPGWRRVAGEGGLGHPRPPTDPNALRDASPGRRRALGVRARHRH